MQLQRYHRRVVRDANVMPRKLSVFALMPTKHKMGLFPLLVRALIGGSSMALATGCGTGLLHISLHFPVAVLTLVVICCFQVFDIAPLLLFVAVIAQFDFLSFLPHISSVMKVMMAFCALIFLVFWV